MTYTWYKDAQQLLNTNSPTLDFPAFSEEHVGSYCCQVSNTCGADVSHIAELALGKWMASAVELYSVQYGYDTSWSILEVMKSRQYNERE